MPRLPASASSHPHRPLHHLLRRLQRALLPAVLAVLCACSEPERPAATQPKANEATTAPVGRLADTAQPLSYTLHMRVDPREPEFSAELTLGVALTTPSDTLWLHGQGLDVTRVQLKNSPVLASYRQVLDSGVARIRFSEPLPAGEYQLLLEYAGRFDQQLSGFFRVQEQGDWYALAKSESIQARKFLIGFDQPQFKAPFSLSLDIPEGFEAIANAPVRTRTVLGDGMRRWTFETTPPMPTYLLSLAVGPFDIEEYPPIADSPLRQRDIPLRAVARRGKVSEMRTVMRLTEAFVHILEQQFSVPYPFRKLDIVAAPDWPSGATELSGAITYREDILLQPENPPPAARLRLLGIHAHELAHMWFGNLVTPPWWDDLWLKESFATWIEPLLLSTWEPEGGHLLNSIQGNFAVMRQDARASTRAIREPIARNEDIRNAYDGITYSKGRAVLHMLDSYLGPERFRAALGDYLLAHRDGVADADDFYRSLSESLAEPALLGMVKGFVEQPGIPLLRVQGCTAGEDQGNARLSLSSGRYQPLGARLEPQSWAVPVCLRYSSTDASSEGVEHQCALIDAQRAELELNSSSCPQWVLPNAGGSGYYRWQLPQAMWQTLLDQFPLLDPGEQLAVVDSLQAAVDSGDAPLSLWLELVATSVATPHTARQVQEATMAVLARQLRRELPAQMAMTLRDALRPLYAQAAEHCAQPPTNEASSRRDREQQLLCARLQRFRALSLEEPSVREALAQRAARYIGFGGEAEPGALDSDMLETALTVAVQDTGAPFFRALAHHVTQVDQPQLAAAAARALGSFREPELLLEARAIALSPTDPTAQALGPRGRFDMLQHMLQTPELQVQHWDWLRASLPALLEVIPQQWRRRTPALAHPFCSEAQAEALEQLFAEHGALAPGYERALAQTLEDIQQCAALRAALSQAP